MEIDHEATVRALLNAAGINPPEEEIEVLVQAYPGLRAAADALYTEEASRYLPAFGATDLDMEAK